MDIEVIVPGHWPIITKEGVDEVKVFFEVVMTKTEDRKTASQWHEAKQDRLRVAAE